MAGIEIALLYEISGVCFHSNEMIQFHEPTKDAEVGSL